MDDFPGNSQRSREPEDKPKKTADTRPERRDEKQVQQVVQTEARQRRQPLSRRFKDTFVREDGRDVFGYIISDVLVPAAKDMMADAMSQGVERLLFGESRGRSRSRGGSSAGYVSYNRYSGRSRDDSPFRPDPRESRTVSRSSRARHDFDEIILQSRADGEAVIDQLNELISKYEAATVEDLYELTGITSNYTDRAWGWTELRGAGVHRVRGGEYLLDLPRPEPLDRR